MKTKQEILTLLKSNRNKISNFGISAIGLFGSYVREEQTNTSDIDILVDFNAQNETYDNFIAVCEFLERVFKGVPVEIVTKNGLSPYIGPKILKEVEYV